MRTSEHCKEIAKKIDKHTSEIISEWESAVRNSIAGAEKVSSPTLIDHLPEVLSNLSQAFDDKASQIPNKNKENTKLAKIHGKQRADKTDYSLEEVLREYSILRKVIWNKVFTSEVISCGHALIFHQFIDEAIQSSVIEFVQIQKDEVQATVDELNEEKKNRGKFVAAMTHDIRTPLSIVRMSAEIVLKRPDNSDVIFKHIPRIINNVDRIDQMVQDLLDASLLKSGGAIPLSIHECNMGKIINETISDLVAVHGPKDECLPLGVGWLYIGSAEWTSEHKIEGNTFFSIEEAKAALLGIRKILERPPALFNELEVS